jgi:mannose-1-phosphate guanylyltransferase
MSDAYALILAGGGGTRLWPASRRSRPKQLLTLAGTESLLGATFRRTAAVFTRERTLIVTAEDQAAAIRAAIPELPAENLVAEPAPRNTAAAVGLGAAVVARRAGRDTVLAVLPSDHHVTDEAAFAEVMRLAVTQAKDAIVTVGIMPTRPETGFGYIERGAPIAPGVFAVSRFVEKPSPQQAAAYLDAGTFAWNAGMFFFTAERFFQEARAHLPALANALDASLTEPDFRAAVAERYPGLPSISIDYGIMERAQGIRVVPGTFGWSDVGSWAALPEIRPADAAGNVVSGDAVIADSRGSVIIAEPGAPLIGVVGAGDLVVVSTKDAVLVIPKSRAQDVRRIVEELTAKRRLELL